MIFYVYFSYFSLLLQYIEDLTQEKFSLTRDLEASRALAESLASENSSLTDSYNQQVHTVAMMTSHQSHLDKIYVKCTTFS